MAKITIEFDDAIMGNFLEQVAEQAGGSVVSASSSASEEETETETEYDAASIKELCTELLELKDKAAVKAVTSEFDCSTVTKACKLTGDDLQDCGEALAEAIKEANDGDAGGSENEEITVDAVKIAVQAFSKKNGKDDTAEILEDFGIKSVRSLKTLSQSDLEDLYAEVCE